MVKFWILFIAIVLAYFVISSTELFDYWIGTPVNSIYAKICSFILNVFQQNTHVDEVELSNLKFTMSVSKGCDAVAPAVMLIAGIGLFPDQKLSSKLKGIGLGLLLLFTVNLIRLISLFLLGVYSPEWFEFFHIQFWQALFIIITLLYFIYWVR
ncbi:MAG: archaeosortase/exosortase family protein [Saprospiraceae bacterium]|nr:archaeosortase/exosortase family protein [Saprospiraceae bacterium]